MKKFECQNGKIIEPHVILRDRTPQDLEAIEPLILDAQAEWRRWDAPYLSTAMTTETMTAYVEQWRTTLPDADEQLIVVNDLPIGMVNRNEYEPEGGGWWDLGILIVNSAYWNSGIGTKALTLWIEDTWQWTNAHVLTVTTWSGNIRMIKAAEKLGFRECMRVREARVVQEQRYDSIRLDLLRSEWLNQDSG